MWDVVSAGPKCRPGPGIHPFVGFDVAISKGDNALATMRTGRIMNDGILNHVHSETGGADAGRIDIHENEPPRRKVGGETRAPKMYFVGAANLDWSHVISRGGPQVRVHGIAANFGDISISGPHCGAIRRAFVYLRRFEIGGKKRMSFAEEVLNIRQGLWESVIAAQDPKVSARLAGLATSIQDQELTIIT